MIRTFFLAFATMLSFCCAAQTTGHQQWNVSRGLALEGYDPVAYFKESKAIEGLRELSSQYQGITYRFKTIENKRDFENNPAAYLPQYGGWCAYAMGASGEKVEVDPGTFKIKDGKLYLFYNRFFNNTLPKWNEDEAALRQRADKNWSNIISASKAAH